MKPGDLFVAVWSTLLLSFAFWNGMLILTVTLFLPDRFESMLNLYVKAWRRDFLRVGRVVLFLFWALASAMALVAINMASRKLLRLNSMAEFSYFFGTTLTFWLAFAFATNPAVALDTFAFGDVSEYRTPQRLKQLRLIGILWALSDLATITIWAYRAGTGKG